MPKYHINTQGEVEICNAVEDDCLLGYEAHFETNSTIGEIEVLIDRKIKEEKKYPMMARSIKRMKEDFNDELQN